MNSVDNQLVPYVGQYMALVLNVGELTDEDAQNLKKMMRPVINLNKNYSELFEGCMEKAIAKEDARLEKGGIFIIMLKNDGHPIFSAFPKEVFYKILNLVKDRHLFDCEIIPLKFKELESTVAKELIIEQANRVTAQLGTMLGSGTKTNTQPQSFESIERYHNKILREHEEKESREQRELFNEFCTIF